ncbi:ABC transporter permease [Pseudobacteriovorax antillogorgiicola]|uniref:Putative ABC transport system permease protein n=1 Tax=Pseudobacteriovorax antillogorgiicola TaxID=1513793 RepID=A0A1Y6BMF6_9BACT|nr:FtsX-like permease family protein [Pseudobacteriovorax antillogorgiicola]TCS55544.1 putative ABC transport system permease protein [Pseudobacteriovorax antillogorgiicola]SMF11158.1 putative ABC transport system permease protein [Pseudobacteriovorax antillogorgiicola]
MILHIVVKSLLNRKFTAMLTILSIALSVSLLLSVERIRMGAREGFTNTITNTDLIVGAKGSPINLLLYTIFHLGTPMENIPWEAYQEIANRKDIDWTIPISLGDSHESFRVVGTNEDMYRYYQYGNRQKLAFASGKAPSGTYEAAIGWDVARSLGYNVGSKLTLSHGAAGNISFQNHNDSPFTLAGILEQTGTPIDRSVFVSLAGIEAIHEGWEDGAPPMGDVVKREASELVPKEITAFLLRTKSRIGTLHLQRWVNEYESAPLMAIIPGITLTELWQGLSYVEKSLSIISVLVVVIGLLGMLIAIYNTLNERRREIAILRSLGASPVTVFSALMLESMILSVLGIVSAVVLTHSTLLLSQEWLLREFSVNLDLPILTSLELWYLLAVIGLSAFLGFLPAARAYRQTLADGLTIKL